MTEQFNLLSGALQEYARILTAEFEKARGSEWPEQFNTVISKRVIGALLARQISYAINVVLNIDLWNHQVGPIVLRPMMETYLKIAWLLQDPQFRCSGIAIADLNGVLDRVQKLEEVAKTHSQDVSQATDLVPLFQNEKSLFDEKVKPIMIDSRSMAAKVGAKAIELYRSHHIFLSSAVHSTWNHIMKFNLARDPNPLHRYIFLPMWSQEVHLDFGYALTAAMYAEYTFAAIFGESGFASNVSADTLVSALENIGALRRIDHNYEED